MAERPHLSESFQLFPDQEGKRVIRGRVDMPADAGRQRRYPTVLIVHGFKGFMNWGFFPELGARLAGAGYAAVFFNTSSSGVGEDLENFTEVEAFERATYTKDLEDIDLVRAEIQSGRLCGVDAERVAILGHSKGGGEALLHAAEANSYRCVIAWAAIHTASRFDEQTLARWRRDGFLEIPNARTGQLFRVRLDGLDDYEANIERFDIQAATSRLKAPTLFVHGTKDESVEVEALDALLGARGEGGEALRLEGAGHTFGISHPMNKSTEAFESVWLTTKAFLEKHLAAGA